MERQQWKTIVYTINRVCRSAGRTPRCRYTDALILKLYFWSVKHDRPMYWALDPLHFCRLFRPRRWPSVSQFNRRLASPRLTLLLDRVQQRLASPSRQGTLFIDGRALLVSNVSQDRDARYGRCAAGMGRGYKLHAIVDASSKFMDFSVLPLNRHEAPAARKLLARHTSLRPRTRVMADTNYDTHKLYKQVHAAGGRLITRLRGRARHPVTLRQMGPARRQMIRLWDRHPGLMEKLYHRRDHIERILGHLTATAGLLGPLPTFIRGLRRVTRWVTAKITLYHARLHAKRTMQMTS